MPVPARSIASIDRDLSEAVKARDSAKHSIQQLSDVVVYNTKKIRELLDERLDVAFPDTPAQLLAATRPAPKPVPAPPAAKPTTPNPRGH